MITQATAFLEHFTAIQLAKTPGFVEREGS
jgi:hypothetical protein